MNEKNQIKKILKLPFFYLIASFIIMDFVGPYLREFDVAKALFASIFYITCDVALGDWKHHKKRNYTLILVLLSAVWLNLFIENQILNITQAIIAVLFIIYTTYRTIIKVITSKLVDLNVVFGSIAGYILIGYVGALVMMVVELISTGSFNVSHSEPLIFQFIYFSFITITSLGYGDILPNSNLARSITAFLAVFGQLYLSILVAIIVGKFLERKK